MKRRDWTGSDAYLERYCNLRTRAELLAQLRAERTDQDWREANTKSRQFRSLHKRKVNFRLGEGLLGQSFSPCGGGWRTTPLKEGE